MPAVREPRHADGLDRWAGLIVDTLLFDNTVSRFGLCSCIRGRCLASAFGAR
jgi:hypothetical protein